MMTEEGMKKKMDGKGGEKWMQDAVKPGREGMFSAKAKKAGMSTSEFVDAVLKEGSGYDELTKKQARLAKTMMAAQK